MNRATLERRQKIAEDLYDAWGEKVYGEDPGFDDFCNMKVIDILEAGEIDTFKESNISVDELIQQLQEVKKNGGGKYKVFDSGSICAVAAFKSVGIFSANVGESFEE